MQARKFVLLVLMVVALFIAYIAYSRDMEPHKVRIVVTMGEYYYNPSEIKVDVNSRVQLIFNNEGSYPHNAYLVEEKRELVSILYPSNSTMVEIHLAKEGVYNILCTIAYPAPVSHYELGMRARLVVR